MVVLAIGEVEVDFCLNCGGVWLDGGELELLLGDEERVRQFVHEFGEGAGSTSPRKCPICRSRMTPATVAGSTEIDRCPNGDGMWFDRGELVKVIESFDADGRSEIAALLRDTFGEGREQENGV
jgi:Zn-finger nucleic acid-binding protein